MTAPLSIVNEPDEAGSIRVYLDGELDISTCDAVDAVVADAVSHGAPSQMVVDLRALRFLDAAGVQALLDGQRYAHARGVRLCIDHPTGPVLRVLTITGTLSALCDAQAKSGRPVTGEWRGHRSAAMTPRQRVSVAATTPGLPCG
ncbi:STAS domain-containing protein [Actinoplanes sp. NPDC048791]|uniref:STAS domain-containing protein n=1 Tax=Actinoplanes sp. NPDC048791 TaxID=3154623 RepID=UPI0033ED98C0